MISEVNFVKGFLSFWDIVVPYMKQYIKICNLDVETFKPIVDMQFYTNSYKSLSAELAFRMFCKESSDGTQSLTPQVINCIEIETCKYISQFGDIVPDELKVGEEERKEAIWLKNNLIRFFKDIWKDKSPIITNPFFVGCGILDHSWGDIIVGDTLFEIKAVDRNFQAPDMRQILTYIVLNYASKSYNIKRICLLNPRRCVFYWDNVNNAVARMSGKSFDWMVNETINLLSSGDLSK